MGGAGDAGPLPLGLAADQVDEAHPEAHQAQDLAAEVIMGPQFSVIQIADWQLCKPVSGT